MACAGCKRRRAKIAKFVSSTTTRIKRTITPKTNNTEPPPPKPTATRIKKTPPNRSTPKAQIYRGKNK